MCITGLVYHFELRQTIMASLYIEWNFLRSFFFESCMYRVSIGLTMNLIFAHFISAINLKSGSWFSCVRNIDNWSSHCDLVTDSWHLTIRSYAMGSIDKIMCRGSVLCVIQSSFLSNFSSSTLILTVLTVSSSSSSSSSSPPQCPPVFTARDKWLRAVFFRSSNITWHDLTWFRSSNIDSDSVPVIPGIPT